jgi:glc operon protein GlcG
MLERMDHAARTASVDLAISKARSAALFKKPTQDLEDAINHGRYAAITARLHRNARGNPGGSGWRGSRSHRRELRHT